MSSSCAGSAVSTASGGSRGRRRARGAQGRRRRDRERAGDAADPRSRARRSPWWNREATTAKVAPASLVDPRRRRRRRRARAGVGSLGTRVALLEGATALIVARGAVRLGAGRGGAARGGRRRAHGRRAVSVARDGEVTVKMEDGATAIGAEILVAVGRKPNTDRPRARDDRARARQAGRGRREPPLVAGTTGSTRSATRTAARCSRTWASTRAGSPPTRSSARALTIRSRRPALAARDLHRPAGRCGRAHARARRRRPGWACGRSTSRRAQRGCELRRPQRARNVAARDRRRAAGNRRRHVHRRRGGRDAARGDDRGRRRGAARTLWHAVPSFPTRSEIWLKLLEAAGL